MIPVLADALEEEEASCEEKMILQHWRERATHVLGCWVIDLLFSKKAQAKPEGPEQESCP
jgi:hypothetical protein